MIAGYGALYFYKSILIIVLFNKCVLYVLYVLNVLDVLTVLLGL